MLYALLLLGLLPAALLIDTSASDDEPAEDDGSDGMAGTTTDMQTLAAGQQADQMTGFEMAHGPDAPDAPDTDQAAPGTLADHAGSPEDEADNDAESAGAETLDIPANAGDAQISGFRPGVDGVTLRLGSAETGFYMSNDSETGDGILHIEEAEGERQVTFVGLDDVPLDDISVSISDPTSGAESVYALHALTTGLGAALHPVADTEDPEEVALEPGDPEIADVAVPEEEPSAEALEPQDPEAPSEPVPGDETDSPLDPVDRDAPEWAPWSGDGGPEASPDDGDPVSDAGTGLAEAGTGGDDGQAAEDPSVGEVQPELAADPAGDATGTGSLAPAIGGPVPGDATADLFQLYAVADDPAVIDDFMPGQDFLRITLDPQQFRADPQVEVGPSGDGLDGLVRIDGMVLAILQGAPTATMDDLHVEVLPDIAA